MSRLRQDRGSMPLRLLCLFMIRVLGWLMLLRRSLWGTRTAPMAPDLQFPESAGDLHAARSYSLISPPKSVHLEEVTRHHRRSLGAQDLPPGPVAALWRRRDPQPSQYPPHRRGADADPQAKQFTLDPPVAPAPGSPAPSAPSAPRAQRRPAGGRHGGERSSAGGSAAGASAAACPA
jgi:hypothetical protein